MFCFSVNTHAHDVTWNCHFTSCRMAGKHIQKLERRSASMQNASQAGDHL